MQQIYKRTSILKCDFNKVALLCSLIEITFWHGFSPVNLLYIFRTRFPKNTCHFWRAMYAKRPNIEEYHWVLEPQYRGNIGIFHIIQYHVTEVFISIIHGISKSICVCSQPAGGSTLICPYNLHYHLVWKQFLEKRRVLLSQSHRCI